MTDIPKFRYPSKRGHVYQVNSYMDMDYLRIVLDLQMQDFQYVLEVPNPSNIIHRFILLDERVLSKDKLELVLKSLRPDQITVFYYCFGEIEGIKPNKVDLSVDYSTTFSVYAEAIVRKSYRKSLFFSSENGICSRVRTAFRFPHSSPTLEEEFICSISSSRDILTCYDQVRGFSVVRVD